MYCLLQYTKGIMGNMPVFIYQILLITINQRSILTFKFPLSAVNLLPCHVYVLSEKQDVCHELLFFVWMRCLQAKVTQPSHNSPLSRHHYGGTTSLLTWGPQSPSPASARDSRPTCSEFTWTPLSILPLLPLPLPLIKKYKKTLQLFCLYVLALTLIFCA